MRHLSSVSFPNLSTEAQTAAAGLLCLLPVLVRHVNFPLACLSVFWVVLTRALATPGDRSLGGNIRGAWLMGGALCMGAAWAGVLVSGVIAITDRESAAELIVMCVVGVAGLLPFAISRPVYSPPLMWVSALEGIMAYGAAVIMGYRQPSVRLVWHQVVGPMMLTAGLASVASAACAALVAPQLATHQVSMQVAQALTRAAELLERCGAAMVTGRTRDGDPAAPFLAGAGVEPAGEPQHATAVPPPHIALGSGMAGVAAVDDNVATKSRGAAQPHDVARNRAPAAEDGRAEEESTGRESITVQPGRARQATSNGDVGSAATITSPTNPNAQPQTVGSTHAGAGSSTTLSPAKPYGSSPVGHLRSTLSMFEARLAGAAQTGSSLLGRVLPHFTQFTSRPAHRAEHGAPGHARSFHVRQPHVASLQSHRSLSHTTGHGHIHKASHGTHNHSHGHSHGHSQGSGHTNHHTNLRSHASEEYRRLYRSGAEVGYKQIRVLTGVLSGVPDVVLEHAQTYARRSEEAQDNELAHGSRAQSPLAADSVIHVHEQAHHQLSSSNGQQQCVAAPTPATPHSPSPAPAPPAQHGSVLPGMQFGHTGVLGGHAPVPAGRTGAPGQGVDGAQCAVSAGASGTGDADGSAGISPDTDERPLRTGGEPGEQSKQLQQAAEEAVGEQAIGQAGRHQGQETEAVSKDEAQVNARLTVLHEELEGDDFMEVLLATTRPRLPRRRALLASTPAAVEILPSWTSLRLKTQLGGIAKALAAAQAEPPGVALAVLQLRSMACGTCGHHSRPAPPLCMRCRWPAVLRLLGQLVDRLASLEAVVDDVPTHLLADPGAAASMIANPEDPGALKSTLVHAVHSASQLLRRLAAQLQAGDVSGSQYCKTTGGRPPNGSVVELQGVKVELAAASDTGRHTLKGDEDDHAQSLVAEAQTLQAAVVVASRAYWRHVVASHKQHQHSAPVRQHDSSKGVTIRMFRGRQTRAFFFSCMALEQSLELCQALGELLGPPGTGTGTGKPVSQHPPQAAQYASSISQQRLVTQPTQHPTQHATQRQPPHSPVVFQTAATTTAMTTSCEACSGRRAGVLVWWAWLRPLLGWLLTEAIIRCTASSTHAVMRTVGGGWQELRMGLRSRDAQAVLKYWLTCAIYLVAMLLVEHLRPGLMVGPPIFGYIACTAVMSDKVETTVSKMAIRIITSNAGACLGAALMASPTTANNPYLLAAVLCIAFAVSAHYAPTQFKLAGLLAVATMASVAGCQYLGCCDHHGSVHYFIERVVTVSAGCVLPVLTSQLIAPWYLTEWASGQLAHSFVAATQLMYRQYDELSTELTPDSTGSTGQSKAGSVHKQQPTAHAAGRTDAGVAEPAAASYGGGHTRPLGQGVSGAAALGRSGSASAGVHASGLHAALGQPLSPSSQHPQAEVSALQHIMGAMPSVPGPEMLGRLMAGGGVVMAGGAERPVGLEGVQIVTSADSSGRAGSCAIGREGASGMVMDGVDGEEGMGHTAANGGLVSKSSDTGISSLPEAQAVASGRGPAAGAAVGGAFTPSAVPAADGLMGHTAPAGAVIGRVPDGVHVVHPTHTARPVSPFVLAAGAAGLAGQTHNQTSGQAGYAGHALGRTSGLTGHTDPAKDDACAGASQLASAPDSPRLQIGASSAAHPATHPPSTLPHGTSTAAASRRHSIVSPSALSAISTTAMTRVASLVATVAAVIQPGAPPPLPPATLADVQGPLTRVQEAVLRDSAIWQRGVLATPPLIHALCAAMAHLVDRLTGLQVALAGTRSLLAGRRVGLWVHTHYLVELDSEMRRDLRSAERMAAVAASVLVSQPGSPAQAVATSDLRRAIAALVARRARTHAHIIALRAAMHARVVRLAAHSPRLPDHLEEGVVSPPTAGLGHPQVEDGMGSGVQGNSHVEEEDAALVKEYGKDGDAVYAADSTAWLACLHALAAAQDAVLQVGRTVAESGAAGAEEQGAVPAVWLK